jgi:hypothetical protein
LNYRPTARAAGGPASGPEQWHTTPWGRLVVGILLSQGLGHGLQWLCTAGLLATSESSSRTVWGTMFGLVLLQVLHALSLLVGGALAAAGQQRGPFLGGLVGLASGFLFLVAQLWGERRPPDVAVYGQPLLALIFGALGGLIGSSVWKPLPALRTPAGPARPRPAPVARPSRDQIAWVRVLLGVGFVAAGVFWPTWLLNWVVGVSQGILRLESQLQAQLVAWEIAGLLTLLGGAIAGATTRAGIKHGFLVGLGGTVLLIGNQLANRAAVLEQTVLLVACILSLTVVGGWFGAHLFPPIGVKRRKLGTIN